MKRIHKILLIPIALLLIVIPLLSGCTATDPITEDIYTEGDIYVWDGGAWVPLDAGGGDVTAAANLTTDMIIRGDGGLKGVKTSTVSIDNWGNVDTNGGDLTGFDINAGNDVNVTNDLDVTDDADVGGDFSATGSVTARDFIDWAAGNVTYVPLAGNIQTYVNNAVAGDTLILASGQYIITTAITINKELNIVGQGNAGFATLPITPSHGTLISCTTNNITAFQINNDNIRIAHLSINMTGDASQAINTANNLSGLVFTNIDVILNCAGATQAFTIYGSNAVLRNLTFYVVSTNNIAEGVLLYNNNTTTQDMTVDSFNVTGTVVGGAIASYAFACWNNNDDNNVTLNLVDTVAIALAGTPVDVAVASYSVTTNNSVINSYLCTLDGDDWDAYQTGTNQLNLGGSVLVNGLVFGTVTYRTIMTSGALVTSGNVNFAGLPIFANNAAAVAGGLAVGDLYRTNADPDLVCVVH